MRRPVGVEADYFERISAMEFAVRNDDGAIPEALRDCDICLVGASRSGQDAAEHLPGLLRLQDGQRATRPEHRAARNSFPASTGGTSSASPSTPNA